MFTHCELSEKGFPDLFHRNEVHAGMADRAGMPVEVFFAGRAAQALVDIDIGIMPDEDGRGIAEQDNAGHIEGIGDMRKTRIHSDECVAMFEQAERFPQSCPPPPVDGAPHRRLILPAHLDKGILRQGRYQFVPSFRQPVMVLRTFGMDVHKDNVLIRRNRGSGLFLLIPGEIKLAFLSTHIDGQISEYLGQYVLTCFCSYRTDGTC